MVNGFVKKTIIHLQKNVRIYAQKLRYYDSQKIAYVHEDAKLESKGYTIIPKGEIEIHLDDEVAVIKEGFELRSKQYQLSSDYIKIYLNEDRAEISGNTRVTRMAQRYVDQQLDQREQDFRQATVNAQCHRVKFLIKKDKDIIELIDNVVINQSDKKIQSNYAKFDEVKDEFILRDNVYIQCDNLDWVIDPTKNKSFQNENIKQSLASSTTIAASKFQFNSLTKKLELFGAVKIDQSNQRLQAELINYDDQTGRIVLKGNVKIKRKK